VLLLDVRLRRSSDHLDDHEAGQQAPAGLGERADIANRVVARGPLRTRVTLAIG
jgi:hypothetical protein